MEPEPPGAASFCLEPEPTLVGAAQKSGGSATLFLIILYWNTAGYAIRRILPTGVMDPDPNCPYSVTVDLIRIWIHAS